MPLEQATLISDLVVTNPAAPDSLAQAADHLRMIKATLKNTFPNITTKLNSTAAQIDAVAAAGALPSGLILMWSGSPATIPAGYHLCDGTVVNGVQLPNMVDRFIFGAGNQQAGGAVGGTLSYGITTATDGAHTHVTDLQGVHSHGGAVVAHQLTQAEMPSHTHTALGLVGGSGAGGPNNGFTLYGAIQTTSSAGGDQPHGHAIYQDNGHTHNASGGAHSHAAGFSIMPPFYAVYFIIKL